MTKTIKLKNTVLGGGNKILIQSMLNADTMDYDGVIKQIDSLISEGCDIIRLAVENEAALNLCKKYLDYSKVPLVADIQFDFRLAIACSDLGFSKIRFNPGNIGGTDRVKEIVKRCKQNKTAIRIGVNSGSLQKNLLSSYNDLTNPALNNEEFLNLNPHNKKAYIRGSILAENALKITKILEDEGFFDIVLSVKSSDIYTTVNANRILAKKCDYPLHIGITESGMGESGLIKSAIGIGALLLDGIGDTVRVSLTGDPVKEVRAAKSILKSLGLIDRCEIISCPTCSRCKCDLESVVKQVQDLTKDRDKKLKIAIMGCAVNGPGEAADADFGVAFGKDNAVIFEKGAVLKGIKPDEVIPEIKAFLDKC